MTRFSYDNLDRLALIRSPGGDTESYEYDEAGNRTALVDGRGQRTESSFDLYSRLRETRLPGDGGIASRAYDRQGRLTREVSPRGLARSYAYDHLGRLEEERDAAGQVTRMEYDPVGNLALRIDPNGTVASYRYSDNNRLETATLERAATGESQSISYTYDEAGVPTSVENGGVRTLLNGYRPDDPLGYRPDAYGRVLRKTTGGAGKVLASRFRYDAGDRLAEVIYPNGRPVAWSYNGLGELTGMPGYLLEPPVYGGGLLERVVAGNGVLASWGYDRDGRMAGWEYRGSGETVDSGRLEYDRAGNITRRNDDLFFYDGQNRLTAALLQGRFPVRSTAEAVPVGHAPEDVTGQQGLAFPQPDEGQTLEILELDRTASSIGVDLKGRYEVSRVILTPQRETTRVRPEQVQVLVSDTNFPGSYREVEGVLPRLVEEEGARRLEIVLNAPVPARFLKVKTAFDERDADFQPVDRAEFFNHPDRLIQVCYLAPSREEHYAYDRSGNRTRREVRLVASAVQAYRYYPGTDRLLTDGEFVCGYDANGNLVSRGTHLLVDGEPVAAAAAPEGAWAAFTDSTDVSRIAAQGERWDYRYDLQNRLVEVRRNGVAVARYLYDGEGLRIRKERPASGEVTWYQFGPQGELLYEQAGEQSGGGVFRQYVYLQARLFAVEEGRVDAQGGVEGPVERRYLHTDHLGSVTAVTDEAGSLVWAAGYTPFGGTGDPQRMGERYALFTGKQFDPDVGLYYFNARWYDPEAGRFISEDPARDGGNWYAYCENNPVGFVDPSGLDPHQNGNQPCEAAESSYSGLEHGSNEDSSGQQPKSIWEAIGDFFQGWGEMNDRWRERQMQNEFQNQLTDYLTQNSPVFDALASGLYGGGAQSLESILEAIPEELRECLQPYVEDAFFGGRGFGETVILIGLLPSLTQNGSVGKGEFLPKWRVNLVGAVHG